MPKDVAADHPGETYQAQTDSPVILPSGAFIANAAFAREGGDLVLTGPDGHTIVVEGYFSLAAPPDLISLDGALLSPSLVDAFLPPQYTAQYAANSSAVSDVSAAGEITEIAGTVTITRADGSKITATPGTRVFAGDIIETSADGAANILFADNTTFAISESGRLSVDAFAFNAAEKSGSSFFSILQGVFVYTSGLIGKSDPSSVHIETPVGSIGIRGTVVAGKIAPAGQESAITLVDGAIVISNRGGTVELDQDLETARLSTMTQAPDNIGTISIGTFNQSYSAAAAVASGTFTAVGNGSFGPGGDSTAPGNDGGTTTPAGEGSQEGASPPAPAPAPPPPLPPPTQGEAPTPPSTFTSVATGLATTVGVPPPPGGVPGTQPPGPPPANAGFGPPPGPPAGPNGPPPNNNPAPPPPSGGANDLRFGFLPLYTKNTMATSDDGIPLFAMGFPVVAPIGAAILNNPSVPLANVAYHLTYSDGTNTTTLTDDGPVLGTIYQSNTITSSNPFDQVTAAGLPFMQFDSQTGRLSVLNPLGFDSQLPQSNYTYTLTAVDTANGNAVLATRQFVLNYQGASLGTVYMGTNTNDGNPTSGTIGLGGIAVTPGNSTVVALDGDDRVIFNGSGNNTKTFMGQGNDLVIINSLPTDLFGTIDGELGYDTVTFLEGTTRDLTAANSLKLLNIEKINIGHNKSITLTIKEIFEMTDQNHTLRIEAINNEGGIAIGRLNVDLDDFTLTDGNDSLLNSVAGLGDVTYQGIYQGQTVTLVIAQGSIVDGIITNATPP